MRFEITAAFAPICRYSDKHLLAALADLVEADTALPLVGVAYALQLLSNESKAERDALRACLGLIHAVIERSQGHFQTLHPMRSYL